MRDNPSAFTRFITGKRQVPLRTVKNAKKNTLQILTCLDYPHLWNIFRFTTIRLTVKIFYLRTIPVSICLYILTAKQVRAGFVRR